MKKKGITREVVSPVGYTDSQVALSNSIVRSAHNLTLNEKRLIATAVALRGKADKQGYIEIDVAEYASTFDLTMNNAYGQCKQALGTIRNKWILFSERFEGEKNKYKGGGFAWCIAYKYNDGEASLYVNLNPLIMPYIDNLESEFSTYKLSKATALRSVYSWRLFELLNQFNSTGRMIITVDDFRFSMGCSDYYKGNFSKLRTKVIEPAVKEIEDKMDVAIHLQTKRKGRKITMLDFAFEPQKQKKFSFD